MLCMHQINKKGILEYINIVHCMYSTWIKDHFFKFYITYFFSPSLSWNVRATWIKLNLIPYALFIPCITTWNIRPFSIGFSQYQYNNILTCVWVYRNLVIMLVIQNILCFCNNALMVIYLRRDNASAFS